MWLLYFNYILRFFDHFKGILTKYLSVFSPIARKYGPEKRPYLDTFHTVNGFETWLKVNRDAANVYMYRCWLNFIMQSGFFPQELRWYLNLNILYLLFDAFLNKQLKQIFWSITVYTQLSSVPTLFRNSFLS